jgi:hypothetical protein
MMKLIVCTVIVLFKVTNAAEKNDTFKTRKLNFSLYVEVFEGFTY